MARFIIPMPIVYKALFAILLLIFGWVIVPTLIDFQISKKLCISPEANPELFKAWQQPTVPIVLKIYIFNVTNPAEVQKGNRLKLIEMGPYVFQEFRTKVNISLNDALDTATYMEKIVYQFRPDLSKQFSLEDKVTLINVPFAAAAIKIQTQLPYLIRHVAHMILLNYKEPLFITKTVHEILFEGWTVPFLEKIENELGISLLKNNRFGFFVTMNNTAQGPFTIKRGLLGDKSLFGQVISFNNRTSLDYWGDPATTCNQINGTDGSIFPPNLNKYSILRIFNAELCRSIYLTYEKDIDFEGIFGYKFSAPASVLEDPRRSKENRCFCIDADKDPGSCLGKGALNLGPCRDGAPVAMSTAHFLDADPKYLEFIEEGLYPENKLHETFVEIEPLTGAVLRANKRIQLNLITKQGKSIPSLSKLKDDMLLPLIWADEGAKLDSNYVEQLKHVLFWIWMVKLLSKWWSLGLISVLCLINIFEKRLTGGPNIRTSQNNLSCSTTSRDMLPLKPARF